MFATRLTYLRFALLLAVAMLSVQTTASARSAQQTGKGKIAQVKIEGLQKYPEPVVVEMSGLHPGDLVGREELQAAADRMAQVGIFASVSYQFKTRGEELRVTFHVEEAPTVPVLLDNVPWFTDEELFAVIRKSLPWFDGAAPHQGAVLDEMASAAQKLLSQRGLQVVVEHELTNDPASDALAQIFRVTGGSQKIGRVEFGDPLAAESRIVQQRLSDLLEKPFSRMAIGFFLSEQVRPIYLQKGFFRVRFERPQGRLTGHP